MNISAERMRTLLQAQCETASRLSKLLEQEKAALIGNNLQEMETIFAAKQQYMADIESISQQYLSSLPNKSALIAALHRLDPQGKHRLEPLWQQAEKLLKQCRERNLVNGKIINLSQHRIQLALSILRGSESGAGLCYNPKGDRPAVVTPRTLGKV